MATTTTTFPRLKSAGVRGAKAVGAAQMVTVMVKTTNGNAVKNSPVLIESHSDGQQHERGKGDGSIRTGRR